MADALGTGNNQAVIYDRGGQRRLFDVPAVASLEWNRVMDAVSRSTISTSPARADSRGWADCCADLAKVQPWRHEVVMYRDGERVWEGPVRRVTQDRDGVKIMASDVLGWTERRVQATAIAATVTNVAAFTDLVLAGTFTGVTGVNVLPYVTHGGGDVGTVTLDLKPGGYWSALLATLVSAGLSFTVVGRRIIYWDDPSWVPGATPILNPERHLIGNVETAREGDEFAAKAYAVNDDGEVGSSETVDDYYGPVERVFTASGIIGTAALDDAAGRWLQYRNPMPESLTLPQDSTLHCNAPFPIPLLVPGVVTPVKVTDLCWPVEQTMQLTGMKVTQDKDGEKVGVSYGPITGAEEV